MGVYRPSEWDREPSSDGFVEEAKEELGAEVVTGGERAEVLLEEPSEDSGGPF
jgi:hypothetical protein